MTEKALDDPSLYALILLLAILFGMLFAGLIGGLLGSTTKKGVAGFFLGFFLGPIGWIIVLLLPGNQGPKKTKLAPRPEMNLESDAYKLWLTKKYKIQKNELFGKYEFGQAMFETLEEALFKADQKECEQAISYEKDKKINEKINEKVAKQEGRIILAFMVPMCIIVGSIIFWQIFFHDQ